MNILFTAPARDWEIYGAPLREAFAETGIDADMRLVFDDPSRVDYLVHAPGGPVKDFRPFTRAKAVLNLWAGVEKLVSNPTLTLPLARMVDEGLTEGMVEYVTGHVLRHHLGLDAHIHGMNGEWRQVTPPLARDRSVGILGLGALGRAAAEALVRLNFRVRGWSRTEKDIGGIKSHHGKGGLDQVLSEAEILVLLLPLTPETGNILDANRLSRLPMGAVIINPARGPMIDDAALLAALDSGQIAHATLDVFREEPLPKKHPFWRHPAVTVTPHIAAETRPISAARVIAENIQRGEAGQPLLHLVDSNRGY